MKSRTSGDDRAWLNEQADGQPFRGLRTLERNRLRIRVPDDHGASAEHILAMKLEAGRRTDNRRCGDLDRASRDHHRRGGSGGPRAALPRIDTRQQGEGTRRARACRRRRRQKGTRMKHRRRGRIGKSRRSCTRSAASPRITAAGRGVRSLPQATPNAPAIGLLSGLHDRPALAHPPDDASVFGPRPPRLPESPPSRGQASRD